MKAGHVQLWLRLSIRIVMAILLVAGTLKLLDLPDFAASLGSWILVPRAFRQIAIYAVPTMEIFLALSWFFATPRVWVLWSAVLLLTAFTTVYGLHVFTVGPPTCKCFGLLQQFREVQTSSRQVIVQNAALCAPLVFGIMYKKRFTPGGGGDDRSA